MDYYYFLYRVTNKLNGRIYIGVHQTKDLNDNYLGSGKVISAAIQKYGRGNFKREILEYFNTKEDMFEAESKIVNKEFLNKANTYNLVIGGRGGAMPQNQKPFKQKHSEETRKKMKISNRRVFNEKKKKEISAKISENNLKTNASRGQKVSEALRGKKKTEEHRRKISEGLKRNKSLNPNSVQKLKFIWTIRLPSGDVTKVTNLSRFCKENRINSYRIYKGTKGYLVLNKQLS